MSQENLGQKAFIAGEALPAYRRVKLANSVGDTVVFADAGDEYIGITAAGADLGENVTINLRASDRTFKMTANGAINAGAVFYGANDGKISASVAGTAQGTALEAASADGDIIEAYPNNGAAANIDGATPAIVADGGNGSIPIVFSKQGITDASGAGIAIVTAPFKFRIISWHLISRDTNAANVKLNNNGTDCTSNKAKGTANDAIVLGGDVVAAQKDVAQGSVLKTIASGAAAFDVFVTVIKVS